MRFCQGRLWVAMLPLLAGACTGPKGDAGPMGPSGAGTPVYYYNNNFDSGGVSEWKTYKWAGDGSIQVYFDKNMFASPGQSLAISFTAVTGLDSLAYLELPINPNLDLWTEFDWNFQGATAGGFEFVEFLGGSIKNSVIGFNASNLYLVQGNSQVDVTSLPDVGTWHHITIKVSAGTSESSYWMDGLTLGTNFKTAQTPNGTPPSGYIIGIDNQAGSGSSTHIDNIKCYHF